MATWCPACRTRGGRPGRLARNARRYGQLTRIAARQGLASPAVGRADPALLARRLRPALEEAGPIFVKLGQVLSTRTDLLPPPVTTELATLQDQVAPAPWPQIHALLADELSHDPGEVFKSVDSEPVASASLAQAHAAWRADGTAVILKIQRPGIDEQVTRDLDMIRRLTRRAESRSELARAYHLADLARGFADALAEELDFRVEARNIAVIAAAAPPDATVLIPAVHVDISTRRLLVLERFDGVSVRDAGPELDKLGADRPALARGLLRDLLRQILLQGTFHADPHPGNVLYLRSGQLGLIDFGSAGRLDIGQQAALQQLFAATGQRDPAALYDAVTELAATRPDNEDALEETLAAFMTRYLGPGMTVDAALIRNLLTVLATAGITFPPVISGVFRTLTVLDGTLRALDPGFDIAAESQALARQFAGQQFTPASLRDAATGELLTLLPMLRKLPRRADKITAAMAQGRFTTSLRLFSDPRDVSVITTLVNRAVLGLLGSALGVVSVILLLVPRSPRITTGITLLQLLGYTGLFLAITLILRVAVEIISPRRRR